MCFYVFLSFEIFPIKQIYVGIETNGVLISVSAVRFSLLQNLLNNFCFIILSGCLELFP